MKMTIDNYLSYEKEKMPEWLEKFNNNKPLKLKDVLYGDNRIVFYPGSGIDGEPIKLINKAHFAHLYFYVDYNYRSEEIKKMLIDEETFKGYIPIGLYTIPVYEASRLVNDHEYYSLSDIYDSKNDCFYRMNYPIQKGIFVPFLYIAIYKRLPDYDDSHGAKRFCLIYFCNDIYGTYHEFFATENRAPSILVLKDYQSNEKFILGEGSNLEFIAKKYNTLPNYILCERKTEIWNEYEKINIAKKSFLDPNTKEVLTLYKNIDFKKCISFDGLVI